MLVDEHADRDAAHVEAVQKVLDILVGYWVLGEGLFVFDDTLGHSRHDIVVPVSDGNQGINKSAEEGRKHIQLLLILLHVQEISIIGAKIIPFY